MFDDIALFVHVAQARSLTGAGTTLGLPAATVTRRLQRLEDKLGHQLVHRSARKFGLTSEGEAYFQAFAGIVEQAEVTARNLSAEMHELSGPLVVAAPTNISVGALQPMWTAFMRKYPSIRLDLRLSNFNIDLPEDRVDLALRIGPQQDQRLYQKKMGSISTAVMAAPSYLEGRDLPEAPDDLKQHAIIAVRTIPAWQLTHRPSGETSELHLKGDVVVDDIALVRQFAEDGFGVCLLSVTEAAEPLEQGRLRLLLPDWQGQQRDIYAVWPTGRLLSARAKCLREYMRIYLAERPVFQGQVPAGSTLT